MKNPKEQPSAAPEQAHTAEPWTISGAVHIWSRSGKANIASASEPRGQDHVGYEPVNRGSGLHEAAANAERIVACVNACAGLNPAALPDVVKALTNIVETLSDSDYHLTAGELFELVEDGSKALANLKPL